MKKLYHIVFPLILFLYNVPPSFGGVLVNEKDILRGKENLTNPVFSEVAAIDYGLGAAVNFILTGNLALVDTAKAAVHDAVREAINALPRASFTFSDEASQKLYDALVMYDLLSDSRLWFTGERLALQKDMKQVLDFYLDYDNFAWEEESWCLGATAMRIVASSALLAFNFPDDDNYHHYLTHSRTFLEKNLVNSIDDYGAWTADSPGRFSDALEYLIITAKVMKNGGIYDFFMNPRLQSVLKYEMNLLPPQQSPLIKGIFMIAGEGKTLPEVNHGKTAVLAAADLPEYSAAEASLLIWFWNQCGQPVTPLGLLYIDTSIPSGYPAGESQIVGNGMTVLRNNFGTTDESVLFAGFGGPSGIVDRERNHHSDIGDFSFVWRGIPLIVHDGFSGNGCSENFMNSKAWRHNIVVGNGLGKSPVIADRTNIVSQLADSTTKITADFYPDGICQFLTTDQMDYVSGKVCPVRGDTSVEPYYRHFLYIKPDALVIWDQLTSAAQPEWNLWMPVERVRTQKDKLRLMTKYGVDLEVLLSGAGTIDYNADKPIRQLPGDWPILMKAESGMGSVTISSLDLLSATFSDNSECGLNIIRNFIALGNGSPRIGFIGVKDECEVLKHLDVSYDCLSNRDLYEVDLSGYSVLIIGAGTSADIWRAVNNFDSKIDAYVQHGGSVLWLCPALSNWGDGVSNHPAFIPYELTPGSCPVYIDSIEIDTWNSLKLAESPLWSGPHEISSEMIVDWITSSLIDTTLTAVTDSLNANLKDSADSVFTANDGKPDSVSTLQTDVPDTVKITHASISDSITTTKSAMPDSAGMVKSILPDSTGITKASAPDSLSSTQAGKTDSVAVKHAVYIPVLWSESWEILASITKEITLRSYSSDRLGEPSRIQVRQSGSGDFLTVLMPRKIGNPYQLDVTNHSSGYVALADFNTKWEIRTGGASWTDAGLSVKISTIDGIRAIYAFDCTYANVGEEKFRSEAPMSLYYSPLEGTGMIMSTSNNSITTSRLDFNRFWAGEVNIYDFSGDVWSKRVAYSTTLRIIDENDNPVTGLKIYENNRFIGSTTENGILPVRWSGNPPEVFLKSEQTASTLSLKPGEMQVRITDTQ
ncbi:MAG: hypothetical protein JXB48_15205 [Candidatus Latescibacteria bacterium]|nr:hypothetical protein [Candidatus Latescibacterota bacterium]